MRSVWLWRGLLSISLCGSFRIKCLIARSVLYSKSRANRSLQRALSCSSVQVSRLNALLPHCAVLESTQLVLNFCFKIMATETPKTASRANPAESPQISLFLLSSLSLSLSLSAFWTITLSLSLSRCRLRLNRH